MLVLGFVERGLLRGLPLETLATVAELRHEQLQRALRALGDGYEFELRTLIERGCAQM